MLVKRNLDEVPCPPLAMDGTKNVSMQIMVGRADGAPNFALRQFRVGEGGYTPRHSHNYEHEVVVLGGEGTVEYDGANHPVRSGDVVFIEPNKLHQFRADRGSDLHFVCLVPVSFDCGKPTPGS
ncbi:MAG: cupin domain-containing protein [Phycisphaerales bacterium]